MSLVPGKITTEREKKEEPLRSEGFSVLKSHCLRNAGLDHTEPVPRSYAGAGPRVRTDDNENASQSWLRRTSTKNAAWGLRPKYKVREGGAVSRD